MVVPYIPIVPNTRTTVVNKTIVYSDTVLPLKEVGANLKVCSISDVSENVLEECLKVVFESNPDVVFNIIQYSKNDKKVYFYTDKEVDLKVWKERKLFKYKPLSDSQAILEEIKVVLAQGRNKSTSQISLFDLARVIRNKEKDYKKLISNYQSCFDDKIRSKFGHPSSLIIYSYDHEKGELKIGFKYITDYSEIDFAQKEDGDVFILKSDTYHAQEVLALCSEKLSDLFRELKAYDEFDQERNYNCNLTNSSFKVAISKYGVEIFNECFKNDFKIASHSYKEGYDSECNSSIVIGAIQNKEEALFKKLFVEIDKCPKWSRGILILLREEQVVEEEILEEDQKRKEAEAQEKELHRQRRIQTLKKIFPFLK